MALSWLLTTSSVALRHSNFKRFSIQQVSGYTYLCAFEGISGPRNLMPATPADTLSQMDSEQINDTKLFGRCPNKAFVRRSIGRTTHTTANCSGIIYTNLCRHTTIKLSTIASRNRRVSYPLHVTFVLKPFSPISTECCTRPTVGAALFSCGAVFRFYSNVCDKFAIFLQSLHVYCGSSAVCDRNVQPVMKRTR